MLKNDIQEKTDDKRRETNIIDLFIFLLKYKWLILSCVILTGISTPLYLTISGRFKAETVTAPQVTLQEKYYYSECIISPSDISRVKYFLQSRDLTMKVAKDNHLPMIRHNIWDEKTIKWVTESLYIWDDNNNILIKEKPDSKTVTDSTATLYIKPQDNFLTIRYSSNNKEATIKILDKYLSDISDHFRTPAMAMLKAQRSVYEKQLVIVKDTYQKAQLAQRLIEVTDRELIAKNNRYYGYEMIDSPYVIEAKPKVQIPKGPSTKKYISITLLLMMAAFVIALAIAGAVEYLTFIKKNDPEGFAVLLKHLGVKYWSSSPVDRN